ncbi:uncharacterized protein LOC127619508 [Xyrauchen texanus]|uniref:uncharacterized protein LOC127619508 n=1 Tax=Xyrauchen texanus TaxID=154827 RepID=UPI00224279BB|nr:uncharacterized protein LOC127619508 [Xyrauchen texanus]
MELLPTMQLSTSFVVFLLFCLPLQSAGTTFLTFHGTLCIDDCKLNGAVYMCKTIDKDGRCQSMYCSPQENVDYWGRQCIDNSPCGLNGQDYYWCKTGPLSWGYCGLVMEDKNHYGSKTGALCYDRCDQKGEVYFWCHTSQGWDYCSPSENVDYFRNHCKEDNPCGKHDQTYYWCWLKKGSWGYCGPVEPKMLLHRSKYHYVCTDECQYYERGDYYWCHTAKDWDYCSPTVNVTYKDTPCRSNHFCGLHKGGYNWCWTTESEYDYCGPIESGECTYVTSQHRNRRAPEDPVLICTRHDKGNHITTTFSAQPAPNDITNGRRWRNEAQNLISRWDNGYLVDQARSNLIHSDNLRIDMQGIITRNNQLYYNLQIQVNVSRRPGESTTVSQIIVPGGIPGRYIRRAFWESFQRQARVFVETSTQNQC